MNLIKDFKSLPEESNVNSDDKLSPKRPTHMPDCGPYIVSHVRPVIRPNELPSIILYLASACNEFCALRKSSYLETYHKELTKFLINFDANYYKLNFDEFSATYCIQSLNGDDIKAIMILVREELMEMGHIPLSPKESHRIRAQRVGTYYCEL